jgi:hypothetical protein
MERLLIGLLVLGLMLAIMMVIAWLAIRESRREYDEEMRRMAERPRGLERGDLSQLVDSALPSVLD